MTKHRDCRGQKISNGDWVVIAHKNGVRGNAAPGMKLGVVTRQTPKTLVVLTGKEPGDSYRVCPQSVFHITSLDMSVVECVFNIFSEEEFDLLTSLTKEAE